MPISRRPVISSMNDLRPVAFTSAVMKVCERVVLCILEKLVKENRSTDNAVLYYVRSNDSFNFPLG